MTQKNITITEEIEMCKDIIWFLKGFIVDKGESCITSEHIESLREIIIFSQTEVNKKMKQNETN